MRVSASSASFYPFANAVSGLLRIQREGTKELQFYGYNYTHVPFRCFDDTHIDNPRGHSPVKNLTLKDYSMGLLMSSSSAVCMCSPRWPSGKGVRLESDSPGFNSRLRRGSSPVSSPTSDLKIGTPVATLPGAWRYRVSAGTSRPGVSIL